MIAAKFTANFDSMQTAIDRATVSIRTFEGAAKNAARDVSRLADAYSGARIQTEAARTVRAVESIGGASRLTASEQRRVNTLVTEAIAKYDALGQKAPADLRRLQAETRQLEQRTSMFSSTLGRIGGLIAATFTVGAITNAVRETVAYAGAMKDTADRLQIGVERVQAWNAAAKLNGTTIEAVSNAAFNLQKNLGGGSAGVASALDRLGLSFDELRGLAPEDQFERVAGRLGDVRSASDRAAIGAQLLGKGYKDVAGLINEGIDEQIAKVRALGLVLDQDTIESVDRLGDAWDTVTLAGQALVARVLVPMTPLLMQGVDAILPLVRAFGEWLPAAVLRGRIALLRLFDAQVALSIKMGELSRLATSFNPFGDVSGLDRTLDRLRLTSNVIQLEIAAARQEIAGLGTTAAAAAGPPDGGGGGVASLDKALLSLRDTLSGAALAQELQQLERAWGLLTPTQRTHADVIARTLEAYEQIRAELPRVGGALEALRTAHLAALEPATRHEQLVGLLARATMPNAVTLYRAGQAALDGLTRSGTLLSSRLVPLEVQMRAHPPLLKSSAIAAADWARQQDEAARKAAAWRAGLDGVASGLATLAQIAPGALGGVAGWLGRMVGTTNAVVKGFDAIKAGMKVGAGTLEGLSAISSGVLGIASAVLSLGSALMSALFKSRAEKTMERVAYEFGASISESLAQGIEDEAKRRFGGNRQASKIWHLDQILQEGGGLSAENVQPMFARFRDLFSMIETGAFTAAEGVQVLDKNFRTFAGYVTKDGALASRELLELIALHERFGLRSAAVMQWVTDRATGALGALTTLIQQAGLVNQEAAAGLEAAVFSAFRGLLDNGATMAQAITAVTPAIDAYTAQLQAAGLTGGAAFDTIRRMAAIATGAITGPLVQGLGAAGTALRELHNGNLLTQDSFNGIIVTVGSLISRLEAQGVTQDEIFQFAQRDLQTLWELWTDHGYVIDDATRALLDQAKAAGVVGDQRRSIEQQQLILLQRQTDALEGMARLFGVDLPRAVDQFGRAIDNLPDDFVVQGRVVYPNLPNGIEPPNRSGSPSHSYRGGTPGLGPVDFGAGTWARLHGRESVVPEGKEAEFAARRGLLGDGGRELTAEDIAVGVAAALRATGLAALGSGTGQRDALDRVMPEYLPDAVTRFGGMRRKVNHALGQPA